MVSSSNRRMYAFLKGGIFKHICRDYNSLLYLFETSLTEAPDNDRVIRANVMIN